MYITYKLKMSSELDSYAVLEFYPCMVSSVLIFKVQ